MFPVRYLLLTELMSRITPGGGKFKFTPAGLREYNEGNVNSSRHTLRVGDTRGSSIEVVLSFDTTKHHRFNIPLSAFSHWEGDDGTIVNWDDLPWDLNVNKCPTCDSFSHIEWNADHGIHRISCASGLCHSVDERENDDNPFGTIHRWNALRHV